MRVVLTRLESSKIVFSPGLCPGPRWGAYDTPPDPLVGWGGDTPSAFPTPRRLRRLGFDARHVPPKTLSGPLLAGLRRRRCLYCLFFL